MPHVYKRWSKNKTTLIFDLDHTLVHVQNLPSITKNKTSENNSFNTRFPSHSFYSTIVLDDTPQKMDIGLIHYRPYLKEFLSLCFEHFNVAFWSSASASVYVKNVVMHILAICKKSVSDVCFVWGRSDLKKPVFVDAFTNSLVYEPNDSNINKDYQKPMHLVFKAFPQMNKKNVILFDNIASHMVGGNRNHYIYVPPFNYINHHDTILLKLLNLLKNTYGLKYRITSHELLPIETSSLCNDNAHVMNPYLNSKYVLPRIDFSLLTQGTEILVHNYDKSLTHPAIVTKTANKHDTHIPIQFLDDGNYSNYKVYSVANDSDDVVKKSTILIKRKSLIHISQIVCTLDDDACTFAYGLDATDIQTWRRMMKLLPNPSASYSKRKHKSNKRKHKSNKKTRKLIGRTKKTQKSWKKVKRGA